MSGTKLNKANDNEYPKVEFEPRSGLEWRRRTLGEVDGFDRRAGVTRESVAAASILHDVVERVSALTVNMPKS